MFGCFDVVSATPSPEPAPTAVHAESSSSGPPADASLPTASSSSSASPAPDASSQPAGARAPASGAEVAPTEAGETVVRVRRRRRAVTTSRTAATEARRLPGTQGDAIRVVESMPGVGRSSFGNGTLLLWGASPDASRIYVDGAPIPVLFHGGGLRSVLNGFFVQNIDLTPGAYGAEYGRATAGMVQIETAALREGVHGYASADVIDASAAASAQLSHQWFGAVGARYGYIDRVVGALAPASALQYLSVPQYFDYQARLEYRIGTYERLSLFVFGSSDTSSNVFTNDDPSRARSLSRSVDFHRVVLHYTSRTADEAQVGVTAWAGLEDQSQQERVGSFPDGLDTHTISGGFRANWLRTVTSFARVNAGIDIEGSSVDLTRVGSLLRPPREGDVFVFGQPPAGDVNADTWHVDRLSLAPFLELPLSFFSDRLSLVPGVRVDTTLVSVNRALPPSGDTPTHGVQQLLTALEPRITANLRLTERVSARAAFGVYNQPPSPADLSSVFGNPTLGYVRSYQTVAGVSVQILPQLTAEAVGFYRTLENVVSRPDASQLQNGAALLPIGTARAYGMQLTVRHTLAHGFTGWITYTLSRSEVTDRPGATTRLSDYDQTHLLTAVASYELPLGFSVGVRARFISGLPRTPVVGRYYDQLTGDAQPIFGATNSIRLPFITSVDVRVDKKFRLGSTEVIAFLDVLNVLNQPAAEEIVYDPTYTQHAYITGLPILADLGLRVEF